MQIIKWCMYPRTPTPPQCRDVHYFRITFLYTYKRELLSFERSAQEASLRRAN